MPRVGAVSGRVQWMTRCVALVFASSGVEACCGDQCSNGSDPCAQDAFDCREDDDLPIDANCTITEPLAVEVGQGRGRFESFTRDEAPEMHYGVQGGAHLFAAVRVENPDPDHLAFRFEFELHGPSYDAGSELRLETSRSVVVSDAELDAAGRFEQTGLVLLSHGAERGLLRVTVTDSCGRTAISEHAY